MMESRIGKSAKNIVFSVGAYFCSILFQFINRTFFIYFLSTEYLGLNGLFSNVLSFLSLADLGIGSAINFALYKPLKERNIEEIKSIMRLYKTLYTIIGFVIMTIGGILTPFLPYLIKDMPVMIPHIKFYYLLYVFNSAVSYFFTYKRSIIICDQREYISSISTTAARILTSILQVIVLFIFKSYSFYLFVSIIVTVTENITISLIADRKYPYLKESRIRKLNKEKRKGIQKNVLAMMCHKIGGVLVSSSDNIIISSFVGLTAVGIYSNYTLIVNSINHLITRISSAITASIGELVIDTDKNHIEEVFNRILFAHVWMNGFSSVCFYCLLQPFINLWIGNSYLIDELTLIILVINVYIYAIRNVVKIFNDASGTFWYNRYMPLIECGVNLIISIPLVIKYEIAGVLIGTIISNLLVALWSDAKVMFRYLLGKNSMSYWKNMSIYFIEILFVSVICRLITSSIRGTGIFSFVCMSLIVFIVSNILFIVLWFRRTEFKYFYQLGMKLLKCKRN